MRIVILDSFPADQGDRSWPELQGLGEVIVHPRTRPKDTLEVCAKADAVITNKAPIDGKLLRALPQIRYVGVCATGTNIVDVDTAKEQGVAVTNVPGYATDSVAQLTFALILQLSLDVAGHSIAVKAGAWSACHDFCFFLRTLPELSGRTMCIIGKGAIGAAVGKLASAFGMKVIYAAVPGSKSDGRVPLLEAVKEADVISLHCPLTPATQNLVNTKFLAACKPKALLINTSRGGLIDEKALLAALEQDRLGGAGLDVLGTEPPDNEHPLLNRKAGWSQRVVITPHIAWGTVEARARLRKEVGENLRAFIKGKSRNRVV